jgi:hypothetical protein
MYSGKIAVSPGGGGIIVKSKTLLKVSDVGTRLFTEKAYKS